MNAVSVLEHLRRNQTLSRAQIAGSLGLTRATVSNIISDLLELNLVRETEFDEGGTGRPGLLLELNPESGTMIAVDIDLDRITVVLANLGQQVLWREQLSMGPDAKPDSSLDGAASIVEKALKQSSDMGIPCKGICVAWAGLINRTEGRLEYGPTSGWQNIPLKSDWEARFQVPIFVENEAHAGAIGAQNFGKYAGSKNLIFLSLGIGLGAGVYVDGVLLRGKMGFAGQVGHTHFRDNGIKCTCGKTGCWVTEIGAAALKRKLLEAGVEIPEEFSSSEDWIDWVLEKSNAGDGNIASVLKSVGEMLGAGAARLVQTFNPSVVIVGGRLAPLLSKVQSSIRETMMAGTLVHMQEPLELAMTDSVEDSLRGCLATVFEEVMRNPLGAE